MYEWIVKLFDFVLRRRKSMELKLCRKYFYEKSTIGHLYVDGTFECFTLEDKVREPGVKVPRETAIPYGTYKVIIDFSGRFQCLMPHILDVPMFEGIRIHTGNTDANTEGCILVGAVLENQDFIGSSRVAFDKLFGKLKAALDSGVGIVISIVKE